MCRCLALAALVAIAAGLSSCSAVLGAIEDRLPPPQEVKGGIVFRYYAPSARQVTLAGNFNNWGGTQGGGRYDPGIDPMSDTDGDGVWTIVVPLPPGRYQYKFVIDGGVRWEKDPNNLDTGTEGGIENSLIVVPPTVKYAYQAVTGTVIGGESTSSAESTEMTSEAGATGTTEPEAAAASLDVSLKADLPGAKEVYVAGDFNGWDATQYKMEKGEDGLFHITLTLPPGTYEYKFIADGNWVEDSDNPNTVPDPYGGVNSVLTVE